ncbi:amidoligase family protein [Nodosilinea sp. LEGE 07088]|uniref:amidoligase family protein n=1 Tax=Nodosilinea sp. LEGE 07088 TaxID=2777968 RepID=UPI001882C294|nr:amidoligase family protein [Nodosilinea sp. LEGE 07088]MBE9138962.1 amidoligase family protein [Nodosilinea sp. LEGE 07088]
MMLPGKVGLEIELMAPRGSSRQALAEAIALASEGSVSRIFYPQSEPSQIPGTPVLENLTLGFEARDAQHQAIAWCVDDLTLQADCDRTCPAQPGWYRIVGDDIRLMQIVGRLTDANLPLTEVLQPVAQTLGLELDQGPEGMVKLTDDLGPPIAVAAPLPGERERPCELITPPLTAEQLPQLGRYLDLARQLNFFAPTEGATHLHFDGPPLCSAPAIRNLVNLLWTYGPTLKWWMGTNSRCQRLGQWPLDLLALVQDPDWEALPWEQARERLKTIPLTKYCDFNLKNLVYAPRHKHTFEIRILPVYLELPPLMEAIEVMAGVVRRAIAPQPVLPHEPWPANLDGVNALLSELNALSR